MQLHLPFTTTLVLGEKSAGITCMQRQHGLCYDRICWVGLPLC
jgi:hypothetical protein